MINKPAVLAMFKSLCSESKPIGAPHQDASTAKQEVWFVTKGTQAVNTSHEWRVEEEQGSNDAWFHSVNLFHVSWPKFLRKTTFLHTIPFQKNY